MPPGYGENAPNPPSDLSNRLGVEQSPYLLQHAGNPVHWQPWGPKALATARRLDHPIFLSIGYSTCHWCHVMEQESFEDPEVARLLNETFVCIKVDREERPDIDQVYMAFCQQMTGSGGWPLNVMLTLEQMPFFAATYIPRATQQGHLGLLDLIPRVRQLWTTDRQPLLQTAERLCAAMQKIEQRPSGEPLGRATLDLAFEQLSRSFDPVWGGFGQASKFPMPHNSLFLLRRYEDTHEPRTLKMVEQTLTAILRGGIQDHLGFGFHRYATDPRWLVPHFEKMLYDQAMLALAYTEAYRVTGRSSYARTARHTLDYVLRDLSDPMGGFHCAEDADSEGEEGRFYLWTSEEIREVLAPEEADLFCSVYQVRPEGNFSDPTGHTPPGTNILHRRFSLAEEAQGLGLTKEELGARLEATREALFQHRQGRVRPHLDDKVLTDWNGLMMAALAKAARDLDRPEYAVDARVCRDFLLSTMRDGQGRLLHRYRGGGEAGILAGLDDLAFLSWGLLELHHTTGEACFLTDAQALTEELLDHFWDSQNHGFFNTSDNNSERLLLRQKSVYDGAIPSGNSVAAYNLLRLGRISGDAPLETRGRQTIQALSAEAAQGPAAFCMLMVALDFAESD